MITTMPRMHVVRRIAPVVRRFGGCDDLGACRRKQDPLIGRAFHTDPMAAFGVERDQSRKLAASPRP